MSNSSFQIASDCVDQAQIPFRILSTGAKIPAIGLGTFGSDAVSAEMVAEAVMGAASVGYRHFDCASVYGNEHVIGPALRQIMAGGIGREDLWINSKVWNDQHSPAGVAASCRRTLSDLELDYLDLYFVHWPFPNFHPPGCTVESRSKDARAYLHENFMQTWSAMEKLVEEGLVRHIGTSNVTVPKLKLILRDCRIKPAVNEMELHPHFQQPELFEFVTANGIVPIGYSPIGSPGRPTRDRAPEDTVDVEDPAIVQIAQRHGIHPASLCVKWAQQRGQIPIPFSVKKRNYLANLQAVVSPPLTDEEMREISRIDRNCRLIKGQVFLWKEGQNWTDLWDINGEITAP